MFSWRDVYPGAGSLAWSYIAATDPATVTIPLPADIAPSSCDTPGSCGNVHVGFEEDTWYSAALLHADGYQRLAHSWFYIPPSSVGCKAGAGADYRGNKAVTVSGYTCQDWALDTPHSHSFNHLPANYCRNPDGEPGPWCYTTDPNQRWELCDVPECLSPPPSPPSPPMQPAGASMDYCEDPAGGDTTVVDTSDASQFDLIDDSPISSACAWTHENGLRQSSNAWGNYPGDNTLTGCNALFNGREFTDFILETEMAGNDNDGVGFNFGWKDDPITPAAGSQRYIAAMINDQWPNPPADGVGGPHMKIRRANGKPCLGSMDGSNNCFDTLAYLNHEGHFKVDSMGYAATGDATTARTAWPLPAPYASVYHEFPEGGALMKLTLIVKDYEARMFWTKGDGEVVAVTADLPASYSGGKIGFFTYAHQAVFTSLKITDLNPATASSMPSSFCGSGACDFNAGLCGEGSPVGCFDGAGADYRGAASTTNGGLTCMKWSAQTPHSHSRTEENYPAFGLGDHNECRNPDGEPAPWCYTTDPAKRWDFCPIPKCDACYDGDGNTYRGPTAETITGRTCQKWTEQAPHGHSRTPTNYPDFGLADHNYCRNPDGEPAPWCYTTDPAKRWEYCPIPSCSKKMTAMVYSEGTTAMSAPSATGQINVVPGELYLVKVEILRNDLGSASERVTAIRVDGVDIGGCNPDGGDYDCTFFDCGSQLNLQNQLITANEEGVMRFEIDVVGHSYDCDCDMQYSFVENVRTGTWSCSMENTVAGRTQMTAVARFTLVPGGIEPPSAPPAPPSPPAPPPPPGVPGHVDGIGIDSDTMTPTCYFPKAGWCRGFDDCSVGYAHSPAQCWNKCYHKYQDDLVAIDLDEFNTDNDCILDHSTDPPTQICHCCCQNACPSCIGAGTEALIIRADWVAEDGSTLLPASCGNPDTSAPAEYQQGNLDMANCPNHRAPQHHAIETATYDPATHSVTVTISGRDADAMHENDWCAPALAPPATRAIPVSDAALLCAQDWHLQLPDDVQLAGRVPGRGLARLVVHCRHRPRDGHHPSPSRHCSFQLRHARQLRQRARRLRGGHLVQRGPAACRRLPAPGALVVLHPAFIGRLQGRRRCRLPRQQGRDGQRIHVPGLGARHAAQPQLQPPARQLLSESRWRAGAVVLHHRPQPAVGALRRARVLVSAALAALASNAARGRLHGLLRGPCGWRHDGGRYVGRQPVRPDRRLSHQLSVRLDPREWASPVVERMGQLSR